MNWLSSEALDPDSKTHKDYADYTIRADADTRTRILSSTFSAVVLGMVTTNLFPVVWLFLVFINEFGVMAIRRRIQRRGFYDHLSVTLSTLNTFYGTVAWCVASIYLATTGGVGEIVLGTAIVVGILTHATFVKTFYLPATTATLIPVCATILAVPVIIYFRGIVDARAGMGVFFAFVILLTYFISATRHSLVIRATLRSTVSGLEEANQELAAHQEHLSQLVDERTRELQEEKLKLIQSLEQERQLNEMQSQFVSVASHEFRTPLAIIDGNARRIGRRATNMEIEDISRRADTIQAAVSRLVFLIETTLDSSRVASGKIRLEPMPVDIGAMLNDVIQRQSELHPSHQLTIDTTDSPKSFVGDPRLLDVALSNIVSNALKYSANNPRVEVHTRQDDKWLHITVKDYGIGIPAKELDQITTRFFRSSNTIGIPGTGIGLNLVRTLIEMHSGKFDIRSEEGAWTEVSVRLPLEKAQPRPASVASA